MYRKIITELTFIVIYGVTIGILLAVVANAFVQGVNIFSEYRTSNYWAIFEFQGSTYSYTGIIFLLLAALVLQIIKFLLKTDGWSGPADSIYAAHSPNPVLSMKKSFSSTLAAFIVASSGGSVGQYGPLVHFGSTAGLVFKKVFNNRLGNDVLIGCGVAAAISAGFNAPLAGVIFAHESILRHFSFRAVAPIFIASISASAFSEFAFNNTENIFTLTQAVPALREIVPLLIFLGPIFSLTAVAFMISLRWTSAYANKSVKMKPFLPFIAALICGIVGTFLPEILGIGIGPINQIINGEFPTYYVALLLIAKISMTSLCIGFGLFGGVVSPALFIGVATGSIAILCLTIMGQTGFEQVIIISAMAAVSASVIGAPISIIIIILELTGSYDYAIAAMIAVTVSTVVTHRTFGLSFFDRQLLDRGVNMAQGRESIALSNTSVSSCVGSVYTELNDDISGKAAYEKMKNAGVVEAYVLDKTKFVGKLALFGAVSAGDSPISEYVDRTPFSLCESDSLDFAMNRIIDFVGETIPILSKQGDSLLAVVTEGDIFQAVIDIQKNVRKIERE